MFAWCSQMSGFRTRVLSSTSSICHYGLWHVATEWCWCLQRVLQDWNKAGTHQPSSAAKNPQRATGLFVSLFAWYLWVKICRHCRVWNELVALWRPTILGLELKSLADHLKQSQLEALNDGDASNHKSWQHLAANMLQLQIKCELHNSVCGMDSIALCSKSYFEFQNRIGMAVLVDLVVTIE